MLSDWTIQSVRDSLDEARADFDKVVTKWDDDDPFIDAPDLLGSAAESAHQAASHLLDLYNQAREALNK